MLGNKTCATCRFFRPLTELPPSKRLDIIHYSLLEEEAPESYGLCEKFNKVVYKYDGKNCPHWEVKKW